MSFRDWSRSARKPAGLILAATWRLVRYVRDRAGCDIVGFDGDTSLRRPERRAFRWSRAGNWNNWQGVSTLSRPWKCSSILSIRQNRSGGSSVS